MEFVGKALHPPSSKIANFGLAHARHTVAVHPQEVQQDACTDDLIIRLPSTERLAKWSQTRGLFALRFGKFQRSLRIMTADRSVNTVHRDEFCFSWKSAGSWILFFRIVSFEELITIEFDTQRKKKKKKRWEIWRKIWEKIFANLNTCIHFVRKVISNSNLIYKRKEKTIKILFRNCCLIIGCTSTSLYWSQISEIDEYLLAGMHKEKKEEIYFYWESL